MESLVDQLQKEMNISAEEARRIIETIAVYVSRQHPLLSELSQQLMIRELAATKNT
jgi:polyhydroxyalkanoate synthesis regulator phasin